MRARAVIFEVIQLLGRYIGAILVALLVSYIISLIAVTILGYDLMVLVSGVNLVHVTIYRTIDSATIAFGAAFAGIYSGSLCLARNSRRLGCVVLTILGLMSYQTLWYTDWRHEVISKHGNSSLAPMIAVAGLMAYGLNELISRRKSKGKPASESPIAEKI